LEDVKGDQGVIMVGFLVDSGVIRKLRHTKKQLFKKTQIFQIAKNFYLDRHRLFNPPPPKA